MIEALPGVEFEATLTNAPPGLVGILGVRIEDGDGGEVLARSTTGIVESPAGSGVYTTSRIAPATAGTYVVVWDDGDTPTPTYIAEELVVAGSVGVVPTVDEVALLLRTRTVKGTNTGLGADTGSGDFTTFDDTTRPTRDEVSAVIVTSYNAMIGRLRVPLIASQYDSFRHVVALYAAVLVEVSFFRESVNEDLLRIWRDEIDALLEAIAVKTEREEPGADPKAYGFGTLMIGGIRTAPIPEADLMEGIDF